MVKVYDSLVPPFDCRLFAVSVSMSCYKRFNVLLYAFQCVAMSVLFCCKGTTFTMSVVPLCPTVGNFTYCAVEYYEKTA